MAHMTHDARARLFEEYIELRGRIEKLDHFVLTDLFDRLDETNKADLRHQLLYMRAYLAVLSRRVAREVTPEQEYTKGVEFVAQEGTEAAGGTD